MWLTRAWPSNFAEIGVILLLFGVGLHFSVTDLLAVRNTAVPGAIGQIVIVTGLGFGLAQLLGMSMGAGLVFGLALSVASTVVVLRALQERRLISSQRGRIAVGWLVVQDLAMVLALVLLPPLAGLLGGQDAAPSSGGLLEWLDPRSIWGALAITLIKFAAFLALMLVVGRRGIPWILHYVRAHSDDEVAHLKKFGADLIIMGEREIARGIAEHILSRIERDRRAAARKKPRSREAARYPQ